MTGGNSLGSELQFGLPILVQVHSDKSQIKKAIESRDFVKMRDFSVGFYLPKHLHGGNAPVPTDPDIKVVTSLITLVN